MHTPEQPPAATPAAQPLGMWDDERGNPWLAVVLYGLIFVAALLASHFWPAGCAT